MTRFVTRQFLFCGVLLAVVAVHIASLCVLVRYYASSFVFEFGGGFASLYWGGDEGFRNSGVYNAGERPLGPDIHFAGGYLEEGQRWEAYGPDLRLDPRRLSERIEYRGVFDAFGYSVSKLRHQDEASSVLIPVGSLAFSVEVLGALLLLVRDWWSIKTVERTGDSRSGCVGRA